MKMGLSKAPGRFRRIGSASFTLVELLIVVAIMAMLSAAVGPGMMRSLRDANLTQAGNRMASLAALARQNALARNAMTVLVLMTNCSWDATLSGRAMTLLQLQGDGTWVQNVPWVILPSGVRAYDDPTVAAPFPTASGISSPQLVLNGNTVGLASCSAFVFNPDGSMDGGASSSRTAYVQFAADPVPSAGGNASAKNYYDLVFSSDTGGVHVVRR